MDSYDYAASLGLDTTHPATIKALAPETYPHAMPADCMYGWLGDKARTLGAPLGWAYTGLLAMFASYGVQLQGGGELRPTLYVAHLADTGVGKSRVQARIMQSMRYHSDTVVTTVPGSERGLYEMFEEDAPRRGTTSQTPAPCRLLLQDEMRQLLGKVNIQGSALGPTLCTLFYVDEASGAIKGRVNKARVRLSILGAVKAKNLEEFREAFASETTAGLSSRFILVPGPATWDWDDTWTPHMELRIPSPVSMPRAMSLQAAEWRKRGKELDRPRLAEIAQRIALISASANGDREVTPECLAAALRFADWQTIVKLGHQPSEARTDDAILFNAMLDAFEAEHEKSPKSWVDFWKLAARKNWNRKYSGRVAIVRKALVESKSILEQTIDDKPTGKVRFNPEMKNN